jgi:hypothetical protein
VNSSFVWRRRAGGQLSGRTQPGLTPAIQIFLRRLHADSTREAYAREISRFLGWLESNAPLDAETLPRYVEHFRCGRSLMTLGPDSPAAIYGGHPESVG